MIINFTVVSPSIASLDLVPSMSKPEVFSPLKEESQDQSQITEFPENSSFYDIKTEEIEDLVIETEELLKVFISPTLKANPKKQAEIKKKIYENIEKIIEKLSLCNKNINLDERVLFRISEIGKKYIEGPTQARLLHCVLEEYRKAQECQIEKLDKEKINLQQNNQLSDDYKIIQKLSRILPLEFIKEVEALKNASLDESSATNEQSQEIIMPKKNVKRRIPAPPKKMKPKSHTKPAKKKTPVKNSKPWQINQSPQTHSKSSCAKNLKTKAKAPVPDSNFTDDNWIGMKCDELGNESLWSNH